MVHLPDGADVWITPVRCSDLSVHIITGSERCFRRVADGIGDAMFSQSLREQPPIFHSKSKPGEESSLAATVRVPGIEQVVDDLLFIDSCIRSIGQFHGLNWRPDALI